jgi:hypothetical protein
MLVVMMKFHLNYLNPADYISIPLTYLCNHSMAVGIFPERFKYSKVKPLYKKG